MKDSDSIDILLFRIAENDDAAAFELIFQQYHKRVYSFAFRLLPSAEDAEEIVQNVFMAIWNQRKNIHISSSFMSYLFGITRHIIYDSIKQKINHEVFVEYYLQHNREYEFITEEDAIYRELEESLHRYIQELPERRRQIFMLSKFEGLSYKKISEKLGISENTIDTQIRHAIGYLRSKFK